MARALIHTSLLCTVLVFSTFHLPGPVTARCETGEEDEQGFPVSPFPIHRTIQFQTPFVVKPSVMYGITMLDINYAENNRAKIQLLAVERNNFTVWMGTMYDTKLYGLGMRWMACD